MAALERGVKQARLAVSGLAVKEVAEAVATHLGLMAPMATIPGMGALALPARLVAAVLPEGLETEGE